MANPVRRDVCTGNFRKEVEQMKKASTMPINGEKLRELVLNRGHISVISEELGYSRTALGIAIKNNKISKPMISLLDSMYGIKYEDYKPEEPKKEEPVPEEKPTTETEVISKDEALLKTIISQLGALNNSLAAIYQKLEEINGNQEKEIHP